MQQVKRLGGEKREVRVALQSAKLNALGITAEQMSQQLAQTNANVPAGRVQWFDQEQSIRVVGSQPSFAERRHGNEPVRRYATAKQHAGTNR